MFDTLLWATDGSAEADAALAHAVALLAPGGRLIVFHCDQRFQGGRIGSEPLYADEVDRRTKIRAQADQLRTDGLDVDLIVDVTHHSAAERIAHVAEEHHADAIICGSRGLGAIAGTLLGSVTRRLIHVATCPVVVVPEGAMRRHKEPVATV